LAELRGKWRHGAITLPSHVTAASGGISGFKSQRAGDLEGTGAEKNNYRTFDLKNPSKSPVPEGFYDVHGLLRFAKQSAATRPVAV